jgi:hypothetical protein
VIRLGRSGRRFERSTDSSECLQYIARGGLSRPGRNGFRTGRGGLGPLRCEDRRRAIMQGAVWSYLVVVLAPALELVTHGSQCEEYLDVRAFVAQPPIKRFDLAVLHRLARPDEVGLHAVSIRPHVHRSTSKFRPIIYRDRYRGPARGDDLSERQGRL